MRIVGGVLLIIGALWIGQGLGYVGGSFMTGRSEWTWIGAIAALSGLAFLVASVRR